MLFVAQKKMHSRIRSVCLGLPKPGTQGMREKAFVPAKLREAEASMDNTPSQVLSPGPAESYLIACFPGQYVSSLGLRLQSDRLRAYL